jgi:hypothetical protein
MSYGSTCARHSRPAEVLGDRGQHEIGDLLTRAKHSIWAPGE